MRMKIARALGSALLLAGCTLEPHLDQPDPTIATAWPTGPAYKSPPPVARPADLRASDIGWRAFFKDPRLQRLIELALQNNRDLREAALNVAAAGAQYRVQRSPLLPTIDASGTGQWQHVTDASSIAYNGNGGSLQKDFTASLGFASYEIDLFGRVRSLSKEAFEQYLGYAETERSTRISLVSQVASEYLTYLADNELLKLTQDTLSSQLQSLKLTQALYDGGAATALALRQAQTSVETARVNLSVYTRQAAQDLNALTLLIGQPFPADLPPGRDLDGQALLEDIPAGLPSDLLTRRPDIMAAEHNLKAANADIGAARAAFFPSITLTGSYGTESGRFSDLFTGPSRTWSFAPSINVPIFTAGLNQANLDIARIEKNIYVQQYQRTIETAFQEVADALAARGTYDDQLQAQQRLVDANADAYNLSQLRFRNGVDDYLSTLDSQRSLYASQQDLVTAKQARLNALVTLYRVLGGGWSETNVQPGTIATATGTRAP